MKILNVKEYTGSIVNNLLSQAYVGDYYHKYGGRSDILHAAKTINYKQKQHIKSRINNYKYKSRDYL